MRQLSKNPDKREFIQDNVDKYSQIIMNKIRDIQISYERIYAAITHRLSWDKEKLSVLAIGGGGYVFPRYVEEVWPGSYIDVAEIDPEVTEAAMQAFGLDRNTTINTVNMDARNYIDELLERKCSGKEIQLYDFIYGDAFNDYSIPCQLITKEFNDKIAQTLTDDGVYMLNLIDIYDYGEFLATVINTLQQTFSNVYVVSGNWRSKVYHNFVIINSKREINLENLNREKSVRSLDLWVLSSSDIEKLKERSRGIVLTDNYVPVKNLLAPVVLKIASQKYNQ